MKVNYCDRCGKADDGKFYYISFEVIPAKFHRKNRDYCEECWNVIGTMLDEKFKK